MDYSSHVNQMKPKFSLVLGSVSSSNLAILAKVQQEKIKSTCLVPLKHPNWEKKKKNMGKSKNAHDLLGRPHSRYIFPGGTKLALDWRIWSP